MKDQSHIQNQIFNDLNLLQIFLLLKPYQPMLVGGCVRDSLLNKKPKDFDIVVPSVDYFTPIIVELHKNSWKHKEAGLRFCVLHVSKDGNEYEIAAFRNDSAYINGKPESVNQGDIHTDSQRRDFTVNALYYDPFSGVILDPTGRGLDDIRTKTLRFVGKASERLKEDPMRAFRFYRFINKGFTPSPKCLRAVRQHFPECVKKLSESGAEGIRNEIERIVL